jgi:TrpR-related protein YerC/YecD
MSEFKFSKKTDDLFAAILSLKNKSECEAFFRDLCTIQELKDMGDRWQVVNLLDKSIAYRDIAKKLGTSTTTVARVAFWFKNGRGGYAMILERLRSSSLKSKINKL